MKIFASDCSPIDPEPSDEEAIWLRKIQDSFCHDNFVVGLGGITRPDEPLVYCERDGTWWTGRYIGSVTFDGGRLDITPRFGLAAIRDWLLQASNVALVDSPGEISSNRSFIVQLLAAVWARSFSDAARHGLPALREQACFKGLQVRGSLDVVRTVNIRRTGGHGVVSVRSERSADHAASRAIIAAYAVLSRHLKGQGIGQDTWIPAHTRELLARLMATVGSRPNLPTENELNRVQYTPITRSFKAVAALSRQIALQRGLINDVTREGESQGVLLDVAELWELYVVAALRRALPEYDVRHGTLDVLREDVILTSAQDGAYLGRLKPDAIVSRDGQPKAVVDAKYKSLRPRALTPRGVQRDDLYQLASYVARYGRDYSIRGALFYPAETNICDLPWAESRNPWILDSKKYVWFVTLPHNIRDAASKIREALVS